MAVPTARPTGGRAATAPTAASSAAAVAAAGAGAQTPRLVRALRGEPQARPPVWAMRQAGRHMKAYREIAERHDFRQRSEQLAAEISLQPYRAYHPDGVILFADIMTPLDGCGVDWEIVAGRGPVVERPVRTGEDVARLMPGGSLDIERLSYVSEALRSIRSEVADDVATLGFVGAPFTLATYLVEGGRSRTREHTYRLMHSDPATLHALLDKLASVTAEFAELQADAGAQAIQIFDSWAGTVSPRDYAIFGKVYLRRVVERLRRSRPEVPIILFAAAPPAGLLESLGALAPAALSVSHTVSLTRAHEAAPALALQGNLDPGVLLGGSPGAIDAAVRDVVEEARRLGVAHVLNLGHGIAPTTPEDSVKRFFDAARSV